MKTLSLISASACLLAFLGGCASPAISPAQHARAMQAHPPVPAQDEWPEPDDAKWRQGSFPTLDSLRLVKPDMSKDQIRELLGWPHFHEGLWGVREWNYLFQLRTGKGNQYKTCQYMVRFDSTPLATGAWWRTTDCAALANPSPVIAAPVLPSPAAAPAPAPVVVAKPASLPLQPPKAVVAAAPVRKISIPADGLFGFNGSGPQDILPKGRAKIEQLVHDIRRMKSLDAITITGHSDRLGTAAHNQALSQARADTARKLLIKGGIEASKVKAIGVGSRQPVVKCEGIRAKAKLVHCLQPNRRVEIEVQGSN